MFQNFRPKDPVEAGWIDDAKWIETHSAFGYYIGLFGTKNGDTVSYLGFGSLLAFKDDIGNIGAIIGVQVMKFRHVFKGASKLKGDFGL